MPKIKRALISVSDKTGVVELARELMDMGVEILSTGGTAKAMRDEGVTVRDVSDYTGFPEMMDGRLKTLHPKVHGGLLGRRDVPSDVADMKAHGIEQIDMVVVNLYPFEQTISKEGVSFAEAIENIDIGGPTMLRSAAKNFKDVTVLVDPDDYTKTITEMKTMAGKVSYKTNARLAKKVFHHTSRYDSLIANYLSGAVEDETSEFPEILTMNFTLGSTLRYGENPHQKAAAYIDKTDRLSIFGANKIQGKEMSYNNYYDSHSALMLALEFDKPACAIIKHNNPCGVALGTDAADAYGKAFKTDPISAYGGVIAFNSPVDGKAAREIINIYVEVVIAPSFTEEAIEIFAPKSNIRLLELPDMSKPLVGMDVKRIAGGILVQDWDKGKVDLSGLTAVTKREATEDEMRGMSFAWKVCKHVKSNAIVYASKERTVGIGVGQTSRLYAARVGAINALEPLRGSVAASDGFFPFRDGLESIKKIGVTAVVQPGGSIKDDEVINAANRHNMAMLFTGIRHFKH